MYVYCVLVLLIPCIPADAIMTNSTNPSNRTMSMVEAFHNTVHTVLGPQTPAGDSLDVSSGTRADLSACMSRDSRRAHAVVESPHWQGMIQILVPNFCEHRARVNSNNGPHIGVRSSFDVTEPLQLCKFHSKILTPKVAWH